MNILSLFDGISCARVALDRAGITVGNYYASEIDKYAIQISKNNYPSIIQLGDIKTWQDWDIDFSKIDLIIAGFPCQAWSVAGKQKGDSDPRGELVHDLIKIWKMIREKNPGCFYIFENVKMKKEFIDYISNLFECRPIEINSALVSAQNRKRLYWTNIKGIKQPLDKKIFLKDILETNGTPICSSSSGRGGGKIESRISSNNKAHTLTKAGYSLRSFTGVIDNEEYHSNSQCTVVIKNRGQWIIKNEKSQCLDANCWKGVDKHGQRSVVQINPSKECGGKQPSIQNRVYHEKGKSPALTSSFSNRLNVYQRPHGFNKGGWQRRDKMPTLRKATRDNYFIELNKENIRKLTPIECERLQTLPCNFTQGVSNTQRYKALGNGFTVDVIAHILSYIPKEKI